MISKQIIDFIFRHPGVEVTFRESFTRKKGIVMKVYDPLKNIRCSHDLKMDSIDNNVYIKYALDIIEKKMYGDKEETQ